jgi:hypothetical protein
LPVFDIGLLDFLPWLLPFWPLPDGFLFDLPPLLLLPGWLECFCGVPGPVVFGGFCLVTVVEEPVVVVLVEEELDEVVVVVVEVEVEVEEQDSVVERTGSVTGSEIEESGVPGGTLTVNESFLPPATVTVITQVSAEAEGIAARPETASTELAATAATTRFRLLNTVALLLPPWFCARSAHRDHTAVREGRY